MFYIAAIVVIAAAVLLVGYGAFLNYASEEKIGFRMSNRVLTLKGGLAEVRSITPVWERDSLNLRADGMTDAIVRAEGVIDRVYVKRGDLVKKGDRICHVHSQDVLLAIAQADVKIAQAQTLANRYHNSYLRYQRLVDQGAVSMEQYEEVQTNYKSAEDEVRTLRLEREQYALQERRLTITAPRDGEVLMIYKNEGNFVTAGTSIALLGDFQTLTFTESLKDDAVKRLGDTEYPAELIFSERDLDKIFSESYRAGNRGKDERFIVRLEYINPPLEVEAALREVRWRVDNTSGLLEPKRYQDVTIRALRQRTGLTVPKEALLGEGLDSVYVWDKKNGQLQLRAVETGADNGEYIEVLSGLREGEIVAIPGEFHLKENMRVDVKLSGGGSSDR